ncbi:hypothetical protein [Amnibacterium sp.]|uniref:hypothetical protein n=1 Tax=Amnibacterium sp. TaxID=1872496 RepID=UPI003F7C9A08
MTGRRAPVPPDVGTELGLVGRGAWILGGCYAVVYSVVVLFFVGTAGSSPAGLIDLALVVVAAALLASPSPTPLPRWRTIAILAISIWAVWTMTWHLPIDRPPGLDAWELGAVNFLLFGLALRARIVSAWIGSALTGCTVLVWSTVATGSPVFGLGFVYGQPVALIAGTIFAVALHRTAARISETRADEQARAAREAHDRSSATAVDAELEQVREQAVPTLQAIARGDAVDPIAVRLLEAELRDSIRGRALVREPLVSVVRDLRARGVDVLLVDDTGEEPPPPWQLAQLVSRAAARLVEPRGETAGVILRLAWDDRRPVLALSIDGSRVDTIAPVAEPDPVPGRSPV